MKNSRKLKSSFVGFLNREHKLCEILALLVKNINVLCFVEVFTQAQRRQLLCVW